MRPLPALFLAAAAMSPGAAAGAGAAEPRAIIQAMLPQAAAHYRARGLCVERRLSASLAFTGMQLAPDVSKGEKRRRPSFRWFVPGGDRINPVELERAEADEINRALDRALSALEPEAAEPITRDLLPKGLSLGHRAHACARSLGLSYPAVAGDLAFVEQSYECGSGCGGIGMVALRRTDGGWRVVAETGLGVA